MGCCNVGFGYDELRNFLVNDCRWWQNEEDGGGLEDGFFFSDPLNI